MKVNDSVKSPLSLGLDKPSIDKVAAQKVEPEVNARVEKPQVDPTVAGNVTLSARAAQLQMLESKVATSKVFDTEKVDAIKAAIARGEFKVDSEKVADGLLDTVRGLLTAR
jgi:negative regulator of flagellin synthesis FlgM